MRLGGGIGAEFPRPLGSHHSKSPISACRLVQLVLSLFLSVSPGSERGEFGKVGVYLR